MKTFLTADTHFGHSNIRMHCNRPFDNIHEHDEALIENWNSVVGKDDHVYHLGDFAFRCSKGYAIQIIQRLNGKIHLVCGNHEKVAKKQEVAVYFEWVKNYHELTIQGKTKADKRILILSHYPMLTWNKARYGAIMAHGHCHSSLDYMNINTTRLDVGVDGHLYCPWSIEEIFKVMEKRKYLVVDQHKPSKRKK